MNIYLIKLSALFKIMQFVLTYFNVLHSNIKVKFQKYIRKHYLKLS